MKTKKTMIKGLAIDVLVVEVAQTDARGMLFYRAEIFVRERRTGIERLVRRTRLPGSAAELARTVQEQGVRALEGLAK